MLMKKIKKVSGGLLALTLISCCLLGGTLAKYTTTVEASDKARVAKFDVSPGKDKDFTIDLFETLLDTKSSGWDKKKDKETDVWSNNKDQVVAPGTKGYFDVVLSSNSEVSVKYELELEAVNKQNIPIEYSTDKKNWKSDISSLSASGTFTQNGRDKSYSETIYWRWVYELDGKDKEARDIQDTKLGMEGKAEIQVKGKIRFTQID